MSHDFQEMAIRNSPKAQFFHATSLRERLEKKRIRNLERLGFRNMPKQRMPEKTNHLPGIFLHLDRSSSPLQGTLQQET